MLLCWLETLACSCLQAHGMPAHPEMLHLRPGVPARPLLQPATLLPCTVCCAALCCVYVLPAGVHVAAGCDGHVPVDHAHCDYGQHKVPCKGRTRPPSVHYRWVAAARTGFRPFGCGARSIWKPGPAFGTLALALRVHCQWSCLPSPAPDVPFCGFVCGPVLVLWHCSAGPRLRLSCDRE